MPIDQLANAILPSFIRDDLKFGGNVFGFVDSGWQAGGMIAALILGLGWSRLEEKNMIYVYSVLVGFSTLAFAFSSSIWALYLFHGAMGLTVWMCRIVINARILEISTNENVGRMRSSVEMMFSLSAIIMCLSPTLVQADLTQSYFLFWASLGLIGTVLAYIWQVRQSRIIAR